MSEQTTTEVSSSKPENAVISSDELVQNDVNKKRDENQSVINMKDTLDEKLERQTDANCESDSKAKEQMEKQEGTNEQSDEKQDEEKKFEEQADPQSVDKQENLIKENMACDIPAVTKIEIKDHKKSSVIKVEDALAYRVDVGDDDEGTSDDSDDSSSSSSSDSEVETKKPELSDRDEEDDDGRPGKKKNALSGVRTRGELFPEELPPLEELKISVDEDVEMKQIGTVSSIVGVLVVVQASKDIPALNEETVLFTENREAFGKIFEVFGPVVSPFYSVRFNSPEDIADKQIEFGQKLFCAPKEQQFTQFVFVEQLKRIKGSDASWENNNEPPSSCLDFSDDEDEKKNKAKNRNRAPVEGATDEQTANSKGRNRQKRNRSENNAGNNQEHGKPGSHRGGHGRPQWPPRQMDSWPPRESTPGCPPRYDNTYWEQMDMSYEHQGQPTQSYIIPGSFHGNRGARHQGPPQQFQNPMDQSGLRPPQRPPFRPRFRGGGYQGRYPQGNSFEQRPQFNGSNTSAIMDTRLVQNPNYNGDVPNFRMERPPGPRTTFGGQPHFNPGPSSGQFGYGPGMSGQYSNGGPQGRW